MLDAASGTTVLEVSIDAKGEIEEIAVARGIEGLTSHVIGWVRAWTWRPATLDHRKIPSVVTVAVTMSPSIYPPANSALPSGKQSPDQTEDLSSYHPPRVISAVFPKYLYTSLFSGAVALEATVGARGELDKVTVLRDVPPLTAAFMESLREWKFTPASLEGKPLSAEVMLVFVYRPPVNH
jgi:hypothetical protein